MASDTVRIICPNLRCRSVLSVPGEARGKTVRCRQCGMRVGIPAAPSKPAPLQPTEEAK
jgi:hypothetical protein